MAVGLQIIGRHLDDPAVLRASAAYEAAAPWKDSWPPMLDELNLQPTLQHGLDRATQELPLKGS